MNLGRFSVRRMDVVDTSPPLTQLQKLVRANGQFRGEVDYLLPNEDLKAHGTVPFKRTRHPEYHTIPF